MKTLTQFLAPGFQGQTPDWAPREDGGDEWDADANAALERGCCLCRRAARFVLARIFNFKPVLRRATAAGAACWSATHGKLPRARVCFSRSQVVLMLCVYAQQHS